MSMLMTLMLGKVVRKKVKVISQREKVVRKKVKVVSQRVKVISQREKVIRKKVKVVSQRVKVISQREKVMSLLRNNCFFLFNKKLKLINEHNNALLNFMW